MAVATHVLKQSHTVSPLLSQRKFSSTDLGLKSRRDLQALAKEYGIGANQKSTMIIAKILKQQRLLSKDFEEPESEDSLVLAGISRDVKKQFEELSRVYQKIHELLNLAGLPEIDVHMTIDYDGYMKFTEDVVDYYGEARRTMETELDFLASYKSEMLKFNDRAAKSVAPSRYVVVEEVSTTSVRVKAKKVQLTAPAKPFAVKVPVTAVRYVAIFVDGIPETVENEEIQAVFDTKALVGRFTGFCKILVLESEVGRALGQKSVSGHKIRVKKWRVKDHHRNSRHHRLHDGRNLGVPTRTVETCKTIGTRMKSIEVAIYDIKRVLKCIASTEKRR